MTLQFKTSQYKDGSITEPKLDASNAADTTKVLGWDGSQFVWEQVATAQLASEAVTAAKADLDGTSGNWTFGTNVAQCAAYPSTNYALANKAYVDSMMSASAAGLDAKDSVRVATTAAGTLATSFAEGQSIDGVALVDNDRILIKNQADNDENGIYVVQVSGAPTRATDADSDAKLNPGAYTYVEVGTLNGGKGFVCTAGNITDGTDWTIFNATPAIQAGVGIATTSVPGELILDLNELTAAEFDPANDSIALIDSSDGSASKKESWADLMALIDGNGLVAAAGVLAVDSDTETGGNIQGANVTANGVGLDVSAIAGTGVEADGSANLRLAAQGNGIAGGAGSTLSVQAVADHGIDVGASGIEVDASDLAESGKGLKQGTGTWQLAVEPNDFAGTGLEDDGSDNLRLAAQGNGIAGGAGSTLSVQAVADHGIDVGASGVEVDASDLAESGKGLKQGTGTWQLAVEPNDFAGTGLEDDGSDNLRLAAQGNGIAGGAGSTLSVQADSTTGGDTVPVSVGANGVGLDVSAIDDGSTIETDGSGHLRLKDDGVTLAKIGFVWDQEVFTGQTGTTIDLAENVPSAFYKGIGVHVNGQKWIRVDASPAADGGEYTLDLVGGVTQIAVGVAFVATDRIEAIYPS